MSARSVWKGVLKVGVSKLPVKLVSAVQDHDIHFHILGNREKARVRAKMVQSEDKGVPLEATEIRKGFEVEPGVFIVLEATELDRLKPKASREIETLRFVGRAALGPEWFNRPYYLAPDGEDGEDAKYFALADSLQREDACAIVRWTMREKSYVGAVTVEAGFLVLITLRYAQELLSHADFSAPPAAVVTAKELHMAEELVSAYEGKFVPDAFRDEYRERLMSFIEAKAKGRRPRLQAVKTRPTGASLDEQLTRSLAALKRREKKVA